MNVSNRSRAFLDTPPQNHAKKQLKNKKQNNNNNKNHNNSNKNNDIDNLELPSLKSPLRHFTLTRYVSCGLSNIESSKSNRFWPWLSIMMPNQDFLCFEVVFNLHGVSVSQLIKKKRKKEKQPRFP